MVNLLQFIRLLLGYYKIVVLITVVMSWIFASGRLSRHDARIRPVMQVLDGLTVPLLRRIRPWMPNTGALDLTPFALLLLCVFIDMVVIENLIQWLA